MLKSIKMLKVGYEDKTVSQEIGTHNISQKIQYSLLFMQQLVN